MSHPAQEIAPQVVLVHTGDPAEARRRRPEAGRLQGTGDPIRVDRRPPVSTAAGDLPLHPHGFDDLLRTAGMLGR